MPRGDLLGRVAGLIEKVRPYDSFAGRLARLTPHERAIYDWWHAKNELWVKSFTEPYGAYEALLEGDTGPMLLPLALSEKLHSKALTIPANATLHQLSEAYDDLRKSI